MHHLSPRSRRHCPSSRAFAGCQDLVRFLALRRIKPHAPPLVRVPVNSFEFQPCGRTPQADYLSHLLRHGHSSCPTPSNHRLRLGLPRVSNPVRSPQLSHFQRQLPSSELSSSSAFLHISTNFTSTRAVPSTSPVLQPHSFKGRPAVEPQVFTPDLSGRLDALYAQ